MQARRSQRHIVERDQGFTLIELLVVIIIIGILAAIAIPVFLNQRKKAVDARVKAEVKNAVTAIETWAVDNPGEVVPPDATRKQDLADYGFKAAADSQIYVSINIPRNGYCISGFAPGDSHLDVAGGDGPVWDSLLGGFLNGGRTLDVAGLTTAPGACGTGRSNSKLVSGP